jgi:hypothetical protein
MASSAKPCISGNCPTQLLIVWSLIKTDTFIPSQHNAYVPPQDYLSPFCTFWPGVDIFPNQRHQLFFFFRNNKRGILAQTVQKNHAIKNITAHQTVPAKKDIIPSIEFSKIIRPLHL